MSSPYPTTIEVDLDQQGRVKFLENKEGLPVVKVKFLNKELLFLLSNTSYNLIRSDSIPQDLVREYLSIQVEGFNLLRRVRKEPLKIVLELIIGDKLYIDSFMIQEGLPIPISRIDGILGTSFFNTAKPILDYKARELVL